MTDSKDQKLPVEGKGPGQYQMSDQREPASIEEGSLALNEADERIKGGFTASTQENPFSSQADAEYWGQVYEEAKYEGRHRFDPSFQWSPAEEKRLVRKVHMLSCTLLLSHSNH